jgi:hypothetical protein
VLTQVRSLDWQGFRHFGQIDSEERAWLGTTLARWL